MRAQKRDGKYLEKIGTYNPNTNPATIDLNLDKLDGCTMVQPTDTASNFFYKGAC
jgi:small subunit ribosomal protein S16